MAAPPRACLLPARDGPAEGDRRLPAAPLNRAAPGRGGEGGKREGEGGRGGGSRGGAFLRQRLRHGATQASLPHSSSSSSSGARARTLPAG